MKHSKKKSRIFFHIVLLFTSIFLSCLNRPEVIDTWPDGTRQRSEKLLKSGHRIEYSYYPNGKIEFKATYLNDKLDGISEYWDESGNLKSVSNYSAGKLHGLLKQFQQNGELIHSVEYFHGRKHGLEVWYWDNGQLKSQQKFEFGEPVSELQRWDFEGKPLK